MEAVNIGEQIITPKKAIAEYNLPVSYPSFMILIKKGEVPSVKLGGRTYLRHDDLLEYFRVKGVSK